MNCFDSPQNHEDVDKIIWVNVGQGFMVLALPQAFLQPSCDTVDSVRYFRVRNFAIACFISDSVQDLRALAISSTTLGKSSFA